jgi:hypothetical protein
LEINAYSDPNPLKPLLFQTTFSHLRSLHLNTSPPSFPKAFLEENLFPVLEEFIFSIAWGAIAEEIPHITTEEMDSIILAFVNRHSAKIRSLSLSYSDAMQRDASQFFGSLKGLPKLETFDIRSKWKETIDGQTSPMQILLDWKPMYLKELALGGTVKQPSKGSVFPPLLQAIPTCSLPWLTIMKLGIPFDISPEFITWIQLLLPQLHTLWLSCTTLNEETLLKLFELDFFDLQSITQTPHRLRIRDGAGPAYGVTHLRTLLLRTTSPTVRMLKGLSRRFPDLRMLRLVVQLSVATSLAGTPGSKPHISRLVRFSFSTTIMTYSPLYLCLERGTRKERIITLVACPSAC